MEFRYFPVKANSKKPLIKKWPEKADSAFRFPENEICNYGLVTGEGFIVIDIDTKTGGIESLNKIKSQLPKTHAVKTPSGGLHLYYTITDEQLESYDIKTRTGIMPGIDIRAKGGYVLVPPSTIDGIPYVKLNDFPIAPLPNGILPDRKQHSERLSDSLQCTPTASEFSSFPEAIQEGERDDTLFRYACSWRERGYPYDTARILMEALHARCDQSSPFPLADALAKLDHAWETYQPGGPDINYQSTPLMAPEQDRDDETLATHYTIDAPEDMAAAIKRFWLLSKGSRVVDITRHPNHAIMTIEEFKNTYGNVRFGETPMPAGWLRRAGRNTLQDVIYWPSAKRIVQHENESFYNIYYGSSLPQLDSQPEFKKIQIVFDHISYLFPEEVDRNTFMNWLIMTVQKPELRIPWAPLIISVPGIGKNWIMKLLKLLLGPHNCSIITETDLTSNYNGYLSEKTLVLVDDIEKGRKLQLGKILKPVITNDNILINKKYGGQGNENIFCNILCFSNNAKNAISISDNDRHFWVHEVKNPQKSPQYYSKLFSWLESDGPAHFGRWVALQDISHWNYAAPPTC